MTVTAAGQAHADVCTTMATGTYSIDGVYGPIPNVRAGGSHTTDNMLHLDAPDQASAEYDMMIIPTQQQGGYTPGPAPSVQLSVDGGPSHSFSFTWQLAPQSGDLGTWNSGRVAFGGLSRGDHVLHETLSMPAGSPDGVYELEAEAYLGPCAMITPTKLGTVSDYFTGGNPAQAPAPTPGGGTTRTPSPRATATTTGTPEPSPRATATPKPSLRATAKPSPRATTTAAAAAAPEPSPTTDPPSPSASPTPSASPSPIASPTPSPSPTPTTVKSPTVVQLAATPAAHSSPALPWVVGVLGVLAALAAGGAFALRRRRVVVAGAVEAPAADPEPAAESAPAPEPGQRTPGTD
ncbi:hypothetical protein OG455_30850 [Kitasatospora sp. NBC_01287]|uniref:hypothetical protein n=1 Tax=Kitasatospora sp. NBC_01287 TaxID=2903573 RepID=UPI00224D42E4|nr:hypothetical protein [Kitasatospora sp. NBC_01287]MCX4749864.1 hypothetical protein [Kitasatospora sp. NBC_01287]